MKVVINLVNENTNLFFSNGPTSYPTYYYNCNNDTYRHANYFILSKRLKNEKKLVTEDNCWHHHGYFGSTRRNRNTQQKPRFNSILVRTTKTSIKINAYLLEEYQLYQNTYLANLSPKMAAS